MLDNKKIEKTAFVASILTLASPIELLKIRMQTNNELVILGKISQNYKSTKHCLTSITKTQGIRSLWKGNGIGIARFFPNESINYKSRQFLQKYFPNQFGFNIIKSILAGWTASSILYPVDIMRISLSNSTEKSSKLYATLKTIVKKNGPKYFYKGFFNSLVGTALFRGSFNGIYDTTKQYAKSIEIKALTAYTSAVIAGSICYPLDILRKRRIMLNTNENIFTFGKNIFKKEGIKGFYKGGNLIFPTSICGAIILLVFDTASSNNGQQ